MKIFQFVKERFDKSLPKLELKSLLKHQPETLQGSILLRECFVGLDELGERYVTRRLWSEKGNVSVYDLEVNNFRTGVRKI